MPAALSKKWQQFWFEPIASETIAVYRILFGFIALIELADISGSFLVWYGRSGLLSVEILKKLAWHGQPRFDLLLLSANDWTSQAYFYSLFLAAAGVMLGFRTRFSTGYLAMGFITLFHHNPFIFNAGESLLRLNAIFLTFSAAGERYSLDSWLRENKGQPSGPRHRCPWPQRMIQLQLAIAYAGAFWWKIQGQQWLNGDAVYYATRLTELVNLPLPLLDQLWFCRLCTWLTVAIELAGFLLIWFKQLRPYVLAALLLLHMGIAYVFFLPLFQGLFMATLVTFLQPETVKDLIERARANLREARHGSQ